MLVVVTVAIIFQRDLFSVVVLTTIYSFLMASVMMVLDAVDVAMTEASVGAGISTVVLLATLHLIKSTEMRSVHTRLLPLVLVTCVGGLLIWGTFSLPPFGTSESVIHKHVAPKYLSDSVRETNVPNVVTSVLADYRGYDTLGETTVIFTAGIGVMLLLRGMRRKGRDEKNGTS
jgi:multicomponent Na+:H+ antiporter subunit B